MNDNIVVKGAKAHNLKNINVTIPRDKLVVITGLSGSGKSSLAFDTLYAEGQRRYVESLSSYARQFLGLMEKPDVESIEGLSPAIAIDQKTTSKNPRSTVGTVTEIYDYIRLLYARIGEPHCPNCGKKIEKQTIDQIVETVMNLEKGTKIQVLAPVIRGKKGEYKTLLENFSKEGFVRARVDGEIFELTDDIDLDRKKKHSIDLVVDRLIIKEDIRSRLAESIEISLKYANNLVVISTPHNEILFSQNYACPDCNISIEELSPRMFSFNNPFGACPECTGIGYLMRMDEDLIIPDKNKTYKKIINDSENYIIQIDNIAKTLTLMEFNMKSVNKYDDGLAINSGWPKFIIYADKEYLGTKYDFSQNQALIFSKDVDKDLTLIDYPGSTSQGIGGNLDKIYGETMGITITYEQWQANEGSINLNEFFANGILCGDRSINDIEIYYKDFYSNALPSDFKRMISIDIKTTFATWSSMINGEVNVIQANEFKLNSETLTLNCQNWDTIHRKSNITLDGKEGDVVLIVYIWVNPTTKFNGKTFCLQFYIKNQNVRL